MTNLIINPITSPGSHGFIMFADLDIERLKEEKRATIRFNHHTKTRLGVTLNFDNKYSIKLNCPSDKFKTHAETSMNYFSGGTTTSYYFVKSKKQDYEQFKEYIKEVVMIFLKHHNLEFDEFTIDLVESNF